MSESCNVVSVVLWLVSTTLGIISGIFSGVLLFISGILLIVSGVVSGVLSNVSITFFLINFPLIVYLYYYLYIKF